MDSEELIRHHQAMRKDRRTCLWEECTLDRKRLHRSRMIGHVYSRLMKYFALIYDVVDNFAERRMPSAVLI